ERKMEYRAVRAPRALPESDRPIECPTPGSCSGSIEITRDRFESRCVRQVGPTRRVDHSLFVKTSGQQIHACRACEPPCGITMITIRCFTADDFASHYNHA